VQNEMIRSLHLLDWGKMAKKMAARVCLALACFATVDCREYSYADSELGGYNLTSCSGASSCGTAMASYNGVSAYSNGADQCTGDSCGAYGTYGYQYQCVELAQRYMSVKHGITPIWYDNANQMCSSHPR
jgi:hypothetical protein